MTDHTASTGPLRRLRKDVFRMSQAAFADALGVNQANISRWERDMGAMPAEVLGRMRRLARARAIRLRDAWLFDGPPPSLAARDTDRDTAA